MKRNSSDDVSERTQLCSYTWAPLGVAHFRRAPALDSNEAGKPEVGGTRGHLEGTAVFGDGEQRTCFTRYAVISDCVFYLFSSVATCNHVS